ncbi:T9SS type A sorting domain-containing protein [Fulvivirgaceae bacterium BMA12]|uniref:T9SS type A sorting domain-containing protein n=1 Tax=Agaribacillus aureus TaxID=3051825 RepID=A0ABT8L7D5_9BACT|nr:T9SS type A sorting domain-containing protein [Fulvivirgaceae bacterium BMA12]
MKKKNVWIFGVLMMFLFKVAVAQSPPPAEIPDVFKNYELDHNGTVIPYRLLTPESADKDQKFPLIVALHGAENFGAPKDRFLVNAGAYALGWLAPAIQNKYPSYVVAPHLYYPLFLDEGYGGWDREKSLDFLRKLINHLLATEKVDPDRIYLTGHSMGGIGTFIIPKHLENYFAALVPMNSAGGCPEVCDEIDNNLYDNLSIWAVHHRSDDADSNVRAVFSKLDSEGQEVYPTHSFGQELIDLPAERIEALIDEHQRYIYTEYHYPCNGDRFFCHTSSMDTILQDTLFQRWVFRQHKTDPEAITITSVEEENNYTINWEVKNPLDSVEVWFRTSEASTWLMLKKILGSKKSFDLVPTIKLQDIGANSKVKLVAINDGNFAYGISESKIARIVTGLPNDLENHTLLTYPNPATNKVHLRLPEKLSRINLRYQIISLQGTVMQSGHIKEKTIDVAGLPAGVYLMTLQSNSQYFRQKLTIAD